MTDWNQLLVYGPTVILLALILAFLLKIAPVWRDVKMREFDLRAEEGQVREKEAAALGVLAKALDGMGEILKSIAIEQRRATETIEILQRVNADAGDHLTANIRVLSERIHRIEDSGGTTLAQVAVDVHKLNQRVGAIETNHVEPETTAAGA